jgi:hypothetical protein
LEHDCLEINACRCKIAERGILQKGIAVSSSDRSHLAYWKRREIAEIRKDIGFAYLILLIFRRQFPMCQRKQPGVLEVWKIRGTVSMCGKMFEDCCRV